MSPLDRLWAGWRSDYIDSGATDLVASCQDVKPEESCVFCRILASGESDETTHIVWRHPEGLVIAILNAYPYTSGHLLVMPVRHVGEIEALQPGEATALWAGIGAAVQAVKASYQPDGLNVGANLGRAAGAGVPGHLHFHVLPRWAGDTNFMTAVAEARVLPESLSTSAARLRSTWPPTL